MRTLLGIAVLAAGVGGVGWYATAKTAHSIENQIASDAADVAASAPQGLTTEVSGRDITVHGTLTDLSEAETLTEQFRNIDGMRVLRMDDVVILPKAEPFKISAEKSEDGWTRVDGYVPSSDLRDQLAQTAPGAEITVEHASGVPDDNWVAALNAGLEAAGSLERGQVVLTDTTLEISGEALMPAQKAAAEALIVDSLPDGYSATTDITVLDDGRPFALDLVWDGSTVSGAGKVPTGYAPEVEGDVTTSVLVDEGWPDYTETAIAALKDLQSGELRVEGLSATLTGQADEAGRAAALEKINSISPLFEVNTDISLIEAQATEADQSDGDEAASDDDTAGTDDTARTNADGTDDAATAEDTTGDQIASADGQAVTAQWKMTYTAADGALVEGDLPSGVTAADVAARMGLGRIRSSAEEGTAEEVDHGAYLDALETVSAYLPEAESLTLDLTGDTPTMVMQMSPGVDTELVALDLSDRLPAGIDFRVEDVATMPEAGATRVNQALGREETFRGGAWLPVLNFTPSLDTCKSEADAVLSDGGVNFLSGEARLDVQSVRAINVVSAIVLKCVEDANLTLEVGGHTDNTGDAQMNQDLSEARAQVVRTALLSRGVPEDAITAVGYGQTQPIADNETEAGRAANRRTELTWFEAGQE